MRSWKVTRVAVFLLEKPSNWNGWFVEGCLASTITSRFMSAYHACIGITWYYIYEGFISHVLLIFTPWQERTTSILDHCSKIAAVWGTLCRNSWSTWMFIPLFIGKWHEKHMFPAWVTNEGGVTRRCWEFHEVFITFPMKWPYLFWGGRSSAFSGHQNQPMDPMVSDIPSTHQPSAMCPHVFLIIINHGRVSFLPSGKKPVFQCQGWSQVALGAASSSSG